MPTKCTTPCLEVSSCGNLKTVQPGTIFTPYVEVRAGTMVITSGSPYQADSDAVVSSFEYGFEMAGKGYGADVEIIDSSGFTSLKLIENLSKTVATAPEDAKAVNLQIDFGWIVKDPEGPARLDTIFTYGRRKISGIVTTIDQSYEGAAVKIKFHVTDVLAVDFTPQDQVFGGDPTKEGEEQPTHLTDAITKLLLDSNPKYPSVKFLDKDGKEPLEFEASNTTDRKKGPLGRWSTEGRSKIDAVRNWLNQVLSKNKRGILIITDSKTGGVIIREDPIDPKAENQDFSCAYHIGTFVVNGGNCSPVLEFKPTINFVVANKPGPVSTSPGGSNSAGKTYDPQAKMQEENKQAYGQGATPTIPENMNTQVAPEDQADKINESLEKHIDTNARVEIPTAIQADLKILGWVPYGVNISNLALATVSIVFINPFHIENRPSGGEGILKWYGLTESNCHKILSNKQWYVQGINHQIQNGTYVTNLKLSLPTPNVDLQYDQPYGGVGKTTADKDPVPTKKAAASV